MMPALPYDVSLPGARRSTSTTAWPRWRSASAVQTPTMPAPSTTMSFVMPVVRVFSGAGRGDDRDFKQSRQHQVAADRGADRQWILEVLAIRLIESREIR